MPTPNQYTVRIATDTVTVTSGSTTSTPIWCQGMVPVGLITPAALTSTALTFQTSADGTTYNTLRATDGTARSYTVTTSSQYAAAPADWAGAEYIKVVCGSTEAGNRTITFILRAM